MTLDILVVDDEVDIRDLISEILTEEGFTTRKASNSQEVFEQINKRKPHSIILDIWLQGSELDGLGILEVIKQKYPLLPVIIISGHGTIQTAVNAIKMGAYDYIEKPFTHDKLIIVLNRAMQSMHLKRENLDLKNRVIDKNRLIGSSSEINKLRNEIDKVASTSSRVMIIGEVGCGKELVARMIHKKSNYSNGGFVVFNPTGMSESRIQQELFGQYDEYQNHNSPEIHRMSLLEIANNGTLYIDEVTDLPISVQARLLKVIQEQTLMKNKTPIKLHIRFISSTTQNIDLALQNGMFRQDLYFRLNVVTVKVPSLAKRKEDIPLLVQYFTEQLHKTSGLKAKEFSSESIAALQSYNWHGNDRQLCNVIEWALIMHSQDPDELIRPHMLPQEITNNASTNYCNTNNSENNFDIMSLPLREAREIFERQYLTAQMNRFNNNISKTSVFVGMERSALHRKLKNLNICSNSVNKNVNDNNLYNESSNDNEVRHLQIKAKA